MIWSVRTLILVIYAILGYMMIQHLRIGYLVDEAKKKFRENQQAEGIRLLERAESLRPQNEHTAWRICEAYMWIKSPGLGIEPCKRAVSRYPTEVLWFRLGQEYLDVRDYADAAATFENITPGSNSYWNHTFYVYSLLLSGQYVKAVPACKEYLKLVEADPTYSKTPEEAEELLAIAYEGSGHVLESQQIYRKYGKTTCRLIAGDSGYTTICTPPKPLLRTEPRDLVVSARN